jgi:hypothetical protein
MILCNLNLIAARRPSFPLDKSEEIDQGEGSWEAMRA